MKRYNRLITSMLTVFVILGASAAVSAYSDDLFVGIETVPARGFHTVITDTEGAAHTLDGVIDASAIEDFDNADKIASYEILSGTDSIISVTLNDIVPASDISLTAEGSPMNGYYSVRFTLSEEDNTECFLTGLSPSNLDMVQRELISAELENRVFEMESLDFIDAEKTDMPDDGDDNLCWAASTADILRYTGWGAKAGFVNEDDIFDIFVDNFSDNGGNQDVGVEWFLNGVNNRQGDDNFSQVTSDGYGVFSGFLPEYDSSQIAEYKECIKDHTVIYEAYDAIEDGFGVGLDVGWYHDGIRNSGHAITMWGYICDRDFDITDAEYHKAVIVSNSDSDQKPDGNRRTAPNKLHVLNMSHYTDYGLNSWRFDDYFGGAGILDVIVLCKPYSDSLPKETDADASLNKFTAADFGISAIGAASDKFSAFEMRGDRVFAEDDNVYLLPCIDNFGKDFTGSVGYSVTVTNKADNSIVYSSEDHEFTFNTDNSKSSDFIDGVINIGGYDKGEYKITLVVNPDKAQPEAYYYDNVGEYDFTVTDGIDASGAAIEASIGGFSSGEARAEFDVSGLDSLDIPDGAELVYTIYALHYSNGEWNGRENSASCDAVPTEGRVLSFGEKVRFCLSITDKKNSFPVINIYSDEYPLSYAMLEIVSETDELTPLETGAKQLAEGEAIKFRI